MQVNIGSTNPVKLTATKAAFISVFPNIEFNFSSIDISSGVSEQPMSDTESIQGAINRAKASIDDNAEYGVGLEGGLHQIDKNWFSCGWAAVINKQAVVGLASSPKILLPSKITRLIHQGKQLGQIDDKVFGVKKSNHNQGNYGLMTQGLITRESAYTQALICALSRFTQEQLFTI